MPDVLTQRWIKNAADEHAAANGCTFDEKAALRVVEFFRRFLCHSKGEWSGQPFELLDWQRDDLIFPIFGWKRPDGSRRFRKTYIELPKKNGKSTIASGVGLYLLVGDGEPGAEVYSAATDQQQASIVHGEAINMVQASPELSSVLSVNLSSKNILSRSKSYYRALSAEAAGKEGLNAHGIICDELHAWYGRKLWDALKYAFRSRRQGLQFVITTAGDNPQSICREQHDYAEQVIAGQVLDDRFFGYIRAAAPGDDWESPEVWHKANPSLGVTIKLDEFAADVAEAKKTPATQASFKRYSLNVWANSANPWLRDTDWDACQSLYTEADLLGRECYGGLDLAKTRDMTAFVLVFPDGTDRYKLLPYFWLPEGTALDSNSPSEYRIWAEQGFLQTTPGNVCDYEFIKARIRECKAKFKLVEYAFDPWNAESTTQQLADEDGIQRFSFAQNTGNFAEPTAEFERLVLNRGLAHNGHPILAWQAKHVNVRSDANGNKKPVKPPSGDKRKIDGIVAAVMALSRALKSPKEKLITGPVLVY